MIRKKVLVTKVQMQSIIDRLYTDLEEDLDKYSRSSSQMVTVVVNRLTKVIKTLNERQLR